MAKGDHVKVRRYGYSHHGIDLGDGTVVHLSGEPLRPGDACVCRVSMEDFLCGGQLRVVEYPADAREAEKVVAAALAQLGSVGYDVWSNNCEHFAVHCKTGRKHSHQIRRVTVIAAAAIAGVAGLISMAAGVGLTRTIRHIARR